VKGSGFDRIADAAQNFELLYFITTFWIII